MLTLLSEPTEFLTVCLELTVVLYICVTCAIQACGLLSTYYQNARGGLVGSDKGGGAHTLTMFWPLYWQRWQGFVLLLVSYIYFMRTSKQVNSDSQYLHANSICYPLKRGVL